MGQKKKKMLKKSFYLKGLFFINRVINILFQYFIIYWNSRLGLYKHTHIKKKWREQQIFHAREQKIFEFNSNQSIVANITYYSLIITNYHYVITFASMSNDEVKVEV